MKLNKAFKFRLLPNQEQIDLLVKTFGCCRFIYNKMLEDKIKHYESSKLCRFCGRINKDLKLSDRVWKCDCGETVNRDENAAINILNEGLRQVV